MNQRALPSKKVLFVATVYTHLAAFHMPFMRLLQDWGCEVHAAASPAEGCREKVEAAGVACWDIPFVRSPVSPKNLMACCKLETLLTRERFGLIHVHTPVAAWLGRLVAKRTGQGPVLYTAHGFHFYTGAPWPYWLLYYPLERVAARWTGGLVVMNGEDYEAARRMGFVPGKNLFYVHGVGVDIETYGGAALLPKADLQLPVGTRVVLCVAEFTANKNHLFLLQAWQQVAEKVPEAVLLLVGDGPLCHRVARRVRDIRLEHSVRLLGIRSDVPNLLALAEVVTLASRREGLPRVLMEAMAAGKPIVATDVRGNRDLVRHGVNGFLVPLGDPGALARHLVLLLKDPALAQEMGERGRKMIRPYALENVLKEMAEIYRRFL